MNKELFDVGFGTVLPEGGEGRKIPHMEEAKQVNCQEPNVPFPFKTVQVFLSSSRQDVSPE